MAKHISAQLPHKGAEMIKRMLCTLMLVPAMTAQAEFLPVKLAEKGGVKTCLPIIKEIAKNQIGDKDHGTSITYHGKAADKRMYTASTVIALDQDSAMYSSIHAVPTANGNCDWSQSMVYSWQRSCRTIRETIFSEWDLARNLSNGMHLTHKNNSADVFIMPTGDSSCLVVRTETFLSK